MRKLIGAVLVLIALAIGLIVFTGEVDEAEAVRRTIESVADGAEAGHLGDTLDPLGEDYEDRTGLSKDELRLVLLRQFVRGNALHVVLGPIDVDPIEGDEAHAEFEVWLGEGGEGLGLWPASTEAMHIEVDLQKRDGDWQIVYSDHERIFR